MHINYMSDNLHYVAHCKTYTSKPIGIRSYTYTISATFNCIFCRNINNDDPLIRVMMTVLPSGHITLAVSRIRCASQSFSTPRTTNPVANTGTAPEIGSRTGYIVPWGFGFQCGSQWRTTRPRMWSGTVHVGSVRERGGRTEP